MKKIRIGSATGWARDRFGPAEDLVKRGNLQYICFECMSEITMSAAQVKKMENPNTPGYDPYLGERLKPIIKECKEKGIKIITNQGWLDPVAAADKILAIAKAQGVNDLKVAAIDGGILTDKIAHMNLRFIETGEPIKNYQDNIVSAEAYLGAKEIVEALSNEADIVITTRVGDACLYLGPLAYEFNWDFADLDAMAKGMITGHLMECACQITGGYFADPGYKEVPDISNLGHPIAEVSEGKIFITKLAEAGGIVSTETCKEQLLYEVQDPANYICPDVVADFTKVKFIQAGKDRVEVIIEKGAGKPKTKFLKALVGVKEGYFAEEMVLCAGPGAMERVELAKSILEERFQQVNLQAKDIRWDYLGRNAVHREASPQPDDTYEAILRVAIKTDFIEEAEKLRKEIDPMAVNGPSATGKWAPMGNRIRPVIGLWSTLVPREEVEISIVYKELKVGEILQQK